MTKKLVMNTPDFDVDQQLSSEQFDELLEYLEEQCEKLRNGLFEKFKEMMKYPNKKSQGREADRQALINRINTIVSGMTVEELEEIISSLVEPE